MFVNSDQIVWSSGVYQTESLKFNDSLFIGGIKDSSKINKKFKMSKGLKGALQKVIINELYDNDIRLNALELGGINRYEGFPCNNTSQCENGGVCVPVVNNFKCKLNP